MRGDQRIVLRLEVDRDAEPITGTLRHDADVERPFTGWLALTEVIESIRGAARGWEFAYPRSTERESSNGSPKHGASHEEPR